MKRTQSWKMGHAVSTKAKALGYQVDRLCHGVQELDDQAVFHLNKHSMFSALIDFSTNTIMPISHAM